MQPAFIPRFICDENDNRCQKFVWGDSDEHRHVHMVNSSNVCRPESWGGLGLCEARDINQTSLMEVNWDFIHKRDDLWVKVVRAKFSYGGEIVPSIKMSKPGSNLSRGISNYWEDFSKCLEWRIGDGKTGSVWNDQWLPNFGCLALAVPYPILDHESIWCVRDIDVTNNNEE